MDEFTDVTDTASSSLFYLDAQTFQMMGVNLAIVLALFSSVFIVTRLISHVDPAKELTKKDNPAFAVAISGLFIGITILLSGAMFGNAVYTLANSAKTIAAYGLSGLVMLAITRVIFDKLVLSRVLIKEDISKGNIGAAFVDAGIVISTAIIIRAVMVWVNPDSLAGVYSALAAYGLSLVLLSGAVFVRIRWYALRHKGHALESLIRGGNTAFCLKFMGRTIGTAFVIAGASHLLLFEIHPLEAILPAWAGIAVIAMVGLSLLSALAERVILWRVDIEDEIINQRNVALGTVQCTLYIALGVLVSELMK